MKKISTILFFVMISSFILPFSVAQPTEVNVGVYILNIGKLDVSSGTYTIDFYLSMKCETECDPSKFEFANGRATSVDKIIEEKNEKFYRIQAQLANNMDLRKFPFDSQTLTIEIEDKVNTKDDIIYTVDNKSTGIDGQVIFAGWRIDNFEAKVVDHEYAVYDETYSKYIFSVNISRFFISSFLKTFLPVIFILIIILLTLMLDPDKVTNRLTIVVSTLIAAVMFHVNITNQIPQVGYLTFADKFMFMGYFVLLMTLVSIIVIAELLERKNIDLAHKLHFYSERLIPIISILGFLILFLTL